jgi:hypothetical protein
MRAHQQLIIENFVRSYNAFDVGGMTKDLSDDVVFENISDHKRNLRTEGLDAFIKQAEAAKQYFSKRKQHILSWHYQPDKITVEIDFEAVAAVDFPDGIRAGDTINLKGISEFTFRNEKIAWIKDIS